MIPAALGRLFNGKVVTLHCIKTQDMVKRDTEHCNKVGWPWKVKMRMTEHIKNFQSSQAHMLFITNTWPDYFKNGKLLSLA